MVRRLQVQHPVPLRVRTVAELWGLSGGACLYGDVRLDDLNPVAIGEFQGNIWSGTATGLKFGYFIDERADER